MELTKHDIIRIRAAVLEVFQKSGLRAMAIKGSKNNEHFVDSERKFIQLFAAEIDRLQATEGKQEGGGHA